MASFFPVNSKSWDNSNSNSCKWKFCAVCRKATTFKSPKEFCFHLRNYHCSKEGGSYVCLYGINDVCPSLPLEGVSDKDYEDHVARDHVYVGSGYGRRSGSQKSISGDMTPPLTGGYKEPSIVQDQFKWTIYNASVNLPAVLNDPRLVKRETDFFTKTWGEAFEKKDVGPSIHLPEINRSHFDKYLSKISEKYKIHVQGIEQTAKQQVTTRLHSGTSLKCMKQSERNRADLDQVPKIFMLPNFSLENPDTFSAVFPWTQVEESKPDKSGGRQSCKLLQEKLSHYLDTVEVQIGEQISMRSEAFFHAMTSHDELQDYMQLTCRAIKQLRDKIHALEETLAKGSLKILKLSRSRTNYAKLHNKLKLISTVHQTQPTIQLLLSTNEFVGALDLISTTQEVLSQELAGIHSFRHLGSQLAELEKIIDNMLRADLIKYVTAELNRPIIDLQALADEEKLIAIVLGMLRQHNFEFVDVIREEAFTALKATIKQSVIEAVATADDIDTEGNVGSLADQMRLLNYSQWMQMLESVFHNILIIINRVMAFHSVIRGVILIAAGRTAKDVDYTLQFTEENKDEDENDETVPTVIEPEYEELLHVSVSDDLDVMITEAEFIATLQNLRKMLCAVSDHAHDRCVKLMVARAEDGFLEKLLSSEFVALSRVIESFVTECEKKCGRRSTSLRGSLLNQANRFVDRFHEERKTKLSLILDSERWKQADVPTEFQEMVDHISKLGRMQLPGKRIDSGKKATEFIIVNGEKFAVVGTVLMLLKMMVEYCECVDDLPAAAQDILTRLIDLLKTFNSRTCQLVLGAGALQLVGLKTISTKNLALASRCLQLIVYYIPDVKNHFKPKLYGKKHMLKHLDQIVKDYSDHIEEILNKLVAIMEGLTESYVIKWDAKAPMPSSSFRSVCKQMTKFHEVIIDVLPENQVKAIFERIHKSFVNILRQQLLTLNVTNDGGPQNGLVNADLVFYENNMKALKGVEDVIQGMQTVWSSNTYES